MFIDEFKLLDKSNILVYTLFDKSVNEDVLKFPFTKGPNFMHLSEIQSFLLGFGRFSGNIAASLENFIWKNGLIYFCLVLIFS